MIRSAAGIVLRRITEGESDMGARVLLENGELLRLRMHGIRSSRNRSNLLSEPGSAVNLIFYAKENAAHAPSSLKEGDVINRFPEIKKSYGDTLCLSAILECAEQAARGEPAPDLYDLLHSALRRFDVIRSRESGKSTNLTPFWLVIFFRIRLLALLGMVGSACASCGGDVGREAEWLRPEVSFLCRKCAGTPGAFDGWAASAVRRAARETFHDFLITEEQGVSVKKSDTDTLQLDVRLAGCLENYFSAKLQVTEALHAHFQRLGFSPAGP